MGAESCGEEGYLDTEAIFVDGTHIKASANLKKRVKKAVPKQAKRYAKELFEEVDKDREDHGKKLFSDDSDKKPPREEGAKETVLSTTDPVSGVFHMGEHKKCLADAGIVKVCVVNGATHPLFRFGVAVDHGQ